MQQSKMKNYKPAGSLAEGAREWGSSEEPHWHYNKTQETGLKLLPQRGLSLIGSDCGGMYAPGHYWKQQSNLPAVIEN